MGRLAMVAALVAMAGCVPSTPLVPGPGAAVVAGRPTLAQGEFDGVKVFLDTGAWTGSPADLVSLVTPLLVTVENNSGHKLDVRYKDFQLGTPSGFRAAALPPFQIQRSPYVVSQPYYPWAGFYVAPPYSPFYPWATPWSGPYLWDGGYYNSYYPYWQAPLPSHDMIERALPEGFLDDKGRVQGFVYFQRLQRMMGTVDFTEAVIDAADEKQLGTVEIPLQFK